ncbi:hypothetical protein GGS20DRAFT_561775 [Poronia punctata]|nr:hypothetical protein GGS20DRAFT_561775 [Poronia punctata]
MAITKDVSGIEVTVRCNQQALHEYKCPNAQDDDDEASCPTAAQYIECIDNTEFDIFIQVDRNYAWGYRNHVLVANTYVDGKPIHGSIIRDPKARHRNVETRLIRGEEVGSKWSSTWTLRKFKFAVVKTLDDATKERIEKDRRTAEGLGTIEVRFTRTIETGLAATSNREGKGVNQKEFELAEKSLKGRAVSHGTTYDACEAIRPPTYVSTNNIEEDQGPIAIFRFLYRSREALKRELIIPRSPSLSPTIANLTPAERDRLARERLDELRNVKVKHEETRRLIKREFGEVFDLTQDKPADPTPKRGRHREVIDLTDD